VSEGRSVWSDIVVCKIKGLRVWLSINFEIQRRVQREKGEDMWSRTDCPGRIALCVPLAVAAHG